MKKSEEELQKELTKIRYERYRAKKNPLRVTKTNKKAIIGIIFVVVFLVISYITLLGKNHVTSEFFSFFPKNKFNFDVSKEIKLRGDEKTLNLDVGAYANLVVKKSRRNNILIKVENMQTNLMYNEKDDSYVVNGDIEIILPEKVDTVSVNFIAMDKMHDETVTSSLTIKDCNLKNLKVKGNWISPIKLENASVDVLDGDSAKIYIYGEKSSIDRFNMVSRGIYKIYMDESKVKYIDVNSQQKNNVLFLKDCNIKRIYSFGKLFEINKEGENIVCEGILGKQNIYIIK